MAYAIVQQVNGHASPNSNVTTFNSPNLTSVTSGNKLYYFVQYQRGTQRTVTASRGSDTFTQAMTYWDATGQWGMAWGVCESPATGTTPVTITFDAAADNTAVWVVEASGLGSFVTGERNGAVRDAPGTATDGVSSGNITPSTQPAMLLAICCNVSASNTPTAGTGFTSLTGVWNYGGGTPFARPEHLRLTSTSAVAATWTASNGSNRYMTAAIVVPEGAGAQSITLSGISSDEAFGSATVSPGAVTVAPSGIASLEAFGTAAVSVGGVSIAPSGIVSEEAFGTATISTGAVSVSPSGIASAEAFGTATISLAVTEILPSSIDSAEAFGTATLTSVAHIAPSGIASAEAFGTARLGLYTIDGEADVSISTPYDNVTLYCDGSGNFFTVQ